jgi:hypothetical protein
MKAPLVTKEELQNIANDNSSLPPTIIVKGDAFHTTIDKKTLYTTRLSREINYESWQEEGTPIYLPDKELIKYRCVVEYVYDDKAQALHDQYVQELTNATSGKDEFYYVRDSNSVNALTEFVTMSRKGCCVPCMRSCFMNFIYNISFFLGYHTIIEVFWRGIGTTVFFHSKKKIALDDSLRAKRYERDTMAEGLMRADLPPPAIPLVENSLI